MDTLTLNLGLSGVLPGSYIFEQELLGPILCLGVKSQERPGTQFPCLLGVSVGLEEGGGSLQEGSPSLSWVPSGISSAEGVWVWWSPHWECPGASPVSREGVESRQDRVPVLRTMLVSVGHGSAGIANIP